MCAYVTGKGTCSVNCVTGKDCFVTGKKDTVRTLTVNCCLVDHIHFKNRYPQKKGFDKDISPSTISSSIKQTVIQYYELSDQKPSPYLRSKPMMLGPLLLGLPVRSLLRPDLVSLSLEISQHLHTILFEECYPG